MIGFDIGTHEVKIVLWDGERIRKAIAVPTPEGLVDGGQIVSYTGMGDFLKETLRKNQLRARCCGVVLPSEYVYLRRLTIPAMTEEQLKVNLPYEFRDYLSRDKAGYFYDYVVNALIDGKDEEPAQLDLTACAVFREIIREYRKMFRRAGLKLKTAIPVECAYANLLHLQQDEERKEYCLVDLGHTATRLYIFAGTQFETTRETEVGLKQLSAPGKNTLELYQTISTDVRKTVNFFGFNHRESDIRDIWCCGGGAQIPQLLETISQLLNLKVHTTESLLPAMDEKQENPAAFSAAIGVAIQ